MNMGKDRRGTSTSKNLNLESKTAVDNPTPEMVNIMVKNAVKCIKKPNGASAEDVCKYIESKYDTKLLRSCVEEALNKGVDTGTFQKVNGQYFIQEAMSRKRDFRNMDENCPDPEFKDAATSERLNPDSKAGIEVTTPGEVNIMVKNAIKFSKTPKGTSLESICKYKEENYEVKASKNCVNEVLREGIRVGTFQKRNGEYLFQKETFRRKDIEDMDIGFPDPKLNVASTSKSINPQSKAVVNIPTPVMVNTMVNNAVKHLKKPKGASLEDIFQYIEDNYGAKVSKTCVRKVLDEGERVGTFEKINEHYFAEKGTFSRKGNEDTDIDFPDPKLNVASTSKSINPQSKAVVNIPTPVMVNTMVNNAVKHLKKPKGASLEDICQYIEDNYGAKVSKTCVRKVLDEGERVGTFEKINEHYFAEKGTFSRKDNEDTDIDFPDPKLNVASTSKSINPQSKAVVISPTPGMINTMVKIAVKHIKKPNGASLDEVFKYIEDNYEVKVSKNCVHGALREGVSAGTFEKINGEYYLEKENSRRKIFVEERFKMSEEKPEGLEKEPGIETLTREMVVMMVKHSIKNMKKAKGASLIDICSYMEEHYRVNMKFSELSHILNDMVSHGVLVKITGADEIERFKFKEGERRK